LPTVSANSFVIGVDVGGTKVSVAALRGLHTGDPLVLPTDRGSTDALIGQIVAQVTAVAGGETPAAVGVGVPSVVDFATGLARSSVNVPLQDVPLRTLLRERLGLAVFVDNDATVAALAEAHDDQGRLDVHSLVMFTVGTGVGGGIVIDGRSYRGATGAAGELGQTLVSIDERIPAATSFPQPGSLESSATGHALDRLAREAAHEHPDSALGRVLAERGAVAGPDAVAAAKAGDGVAIECVATLGRRLGVGVANAINTFDPQVVAIGGGVSSAGELLVGPARAVALEYVLPGVGTATEIRIARSGPAAGVRGAALLARSELKRQNGEAR
jgi:glucokinase